MAETARHSCHASLSSWIVLSKNSELRKASAAAIARIRDPAAVLLDQLAKRNELSPAVLPELRSIFAGVTPISTWKVLGPFPIKGGPALAADRPIESSASFEGVAGKRVTWKTAGRSMTTARSIWDDFYNHDDDRSAYGYAEVTSPVAEAGAGGGGFGRHAHGLDQRQAGLRLHRPPRLFRRRRPFRGDVASGGQPRLDSLRESGRSVAVLGRRHGGGRPRILESARR